MNGRRGLTACVPLLVVAAVVGVAVVATRSQPPSSKSALSGCAGGAQAVASLFSDDQTTAIRLSQPDQNEVRVLRTEPANVLPGMFDALVAVSPDSSKVAYVTARNELMDGAHVYSIEVAHPENRPEIAAVQAGLWPVRPVWSPDGNRVAYAVASAQAPYTFTVWTADAATAGTTSGWSTRARTSCRPPSRLCAGRRTPR